MTSPGDERGHPVDRFRSLFERAIASEPSDATAAALATAGADARPSVRMVLVKQADAEGFVFFTNLRSRKAAQLDENPWAGLCFYWPSIEHQVRVEGRIVRLPESEADAYFVSRSRESRLGAWASKQSSPLGSREELEARYERYEERFAGQEVPRPPFWGGYRLEPDRMEFWTGRRHRLHDREVSTRDGEEWRWQRVYP